MTSSAWIYSVIDRPNSVELTLTLKDAVRLRASCMRITSIVILGGMLLAVLFAAFPSGGSTVLIAGAALIISAAFASPLTPVIEGGC